jgi:hypothetical protein
MELKRPLDRAAQGPNAIGVPSAELSLGWLLASRANLRFTRLRRDTATVPAIQDQSRVPVRKTCTCVAKECSFFVQRVGSTSARSLDIGETLLRSWKITFQTEGDQAFPGNGRLPAVEDELRRLRADNKRLLMEREILKKAAAFFAKEAM